MNANILLRGFFLFLIAGTIAYCSYFREDKESGTLPPDRKGPRYANYFPVDILPLFILCLFVVCFCRYGWDITARLMLSWGFGTFFHISLFYIVLLLLMPLLRKFFSARSCAELWLLPTLFYMTEHSFMTLPKPLLVLSFPDKLVTGFLIIWVTGFVGIFLWQVISHLIFRHHILAQARAVQNEQILTIWEEERNLAEFTKNYRLLISPAVKTPLSIGLFHRAIRVVLPQRSYTDSQLHLLLRHELIHIGRQDSGAKFFMMFCTSVCWFHPLMWAAMRKSAADLELSCDETVLLDADENTRREYAGLILHTAGSNHGFTTCLSASASALRYRLRNIMDGKKRLNGGLIVGLALFVFMMTSGYVALGYEHTSGTDTIFSSGDIAEYTVQSIYYDKDSLLSYYQCKEEEALLNYLADLTFTRITGNYNFSESEHEMTVILKGPEGAFGMVLTEASVKLVPLHENSSEARNSHYFYLTSQIDWKYLDSLLTGPES